MSSPPSDDPRIVRRTQVVDVVRAVPAGVLVPIESTIVLTIAITQFEAAGWVKGVVAAAAGVGLLASPFVTAAARRHQRPVMVVAAAISVIGAAGFALAASGALALLVVGSVIGIAAISAPIPLQTATYERNFSVLDRGRRVGRGMAVRVAVGAAAVALAAVALCQANVPSEPLAPVEGRTSPLPHFHLLGEDRQLRLTLIAWMLMGFGNLMLLPLRVEFLANPRYGIDADPAQITLLTVTVPSVVRLLCMPLFGGLFDRMSFFSARIMVNLLFALYVGAFFSGSSDLGLFLGAVAFGVGSAGGDLMWSLWVTKFAPPGRVADYMGLHTFFTGVRATCAPLLGFLVIERFDLETVAWIAAALIIVSSMVLLPEARLERANRRAAGLAATETAGGPVRR